MATDESPEMVDVEKSTEQLIAEMNDKLASLSQAISELRKGVEDAKTLPETQNARKTLESIDTLGSKARTAVEAINQDSKFAVEARAAAEKNNAEIEVILKSAKTKEEEYHALQDKMVKELDGAQTKLNGIIEAADNNIEQQRQHIEELIPGATTAKLASSFKNRKDLISEYGWVWTVLLVLASLGLVSVGIIAIVFPGEHFWSTLPARAIVVVGLLFIEEFARRNYNIKFRLSEAYGYREALAEFFYGYRSEIKGMQIHDASNGQQEVDAERRLVEIFMNELANEPGRDVFEKEKPSLVAEKILNKITDSSKEDGAMVSKVANGNLLEKISWPIVVMCAIIMLGIIMAMYMTRFVSNGLTSTPL